MWTRLANRSLAFAVLLGLVGQFVQFASFGPRRLAVEREVKLKLKAGVPVSERTYFTLSVREYDALHWLKPGKEFTMGHGFFDVIQKTVSTDGLIHLACMNDHQEAELFAGLSVLVALQMDHRAAGPKGLLTVLGIAKSWCSMRSQMIMPENPVASIHPPWSPVASALPGFGRTVFQPPRS